MLNKIKIKRVFGGILVFSLLLNAVQGGINITLYTKASEFDSSESSTNATAEDNVTIDGQYVIRSTTAISDAYRSGDASNLSDDEKQTLEMASGVLNDIITDDMSDYEKEKAVYDWMCANLTTDEGIMTVVTTTADGVDTPSGVLKNHKAICVGYATTFRLFMQILGIECMVIHDTELMHAWNLVKLNNHWYHTDIYSDAGSGNYAAFNLNDDMIRDGDEDVSEWDTEFFPAADSVEYNYLYQNSEAANDIYSLAYRLRTALDSDETAVALKYNTILTDEEKQIASATVESVSSRLMFTQRDLNREIYLNSSLTDIDGGTFVLVNIITYEAEDDEDYQKESTLSDEVKTKLNAAVEAAFSDYNK